MRKRRAYAMAAALERHACLRVMVIANAIGLLRDLRDLRELPRIAAASRDPLGAMRSSAWLLIVRHADDRQPVLFGWTGDDALLDLVWTAFARHGLYGLRPSDGRLAWQTPVCDAEGVSRQWRCPRHAGEVSAPAPAMTAPRTRFIGLTTDQLSGGGR